MKTIKGIEIDESKDLAFNLEKLRAELNDKYSFWHAYKKGLNKIKASNSDKEVDVVTKCLYFLSLFPKYIRSFFISKKINLIIRDAEDELIHFYSLPETKIKHFRLQCAKEALKYQVEIRIIQEELTKHKENINLDFLGKNTKEEINNLIKRYSSSLEKKNSLLNFYVDCQKRLLSIEKQIEVRKLIESSEKLINEMVDEKNEIDKQVEMETEFKVFNYYGGILEELDTRFKKVEEEEDEKVAELELKEIITQINRMNLD